MRSHSLVAAVGLLLSLELMAAAATPAPLVLDVWPDGKAPGAAASAEPEKWDSNKPGQAPFKRVTNVSRPTISVFRPPAEKDTGVSVLICPGGGYRMLMMDYEGEDVATWLNTIGVTGIVLKYRVPAPADSPRHLPALQDAQRALSLIRSKAKEWKLDPDRIGMLGFSAGAHLTAAAAASPENRAYKSLDEVDQASCRVDFAIVIYPGGAIDKETGQITPETRPTEKNPPTFMAMAHDDRVNSENAVMLYLGLKKAGVSAELHIYASGGHGFGMRPSTRPSATWPQRCKEWMVDRGILKGESAK